MPKIIENVRAQLLSEAKKQITEQGYKNTTIRSVATACGIATGTVYNYFKSKDMLIASFILEDWLDCIETISSQPKESHRKYLENIHFSLKKFEKKYNALFSDEAAKIVFNTAFSERHIQLRSQLASLILPICCGEDLFLAEFVAESLLCWTMAGKKFDEIYSFLPEQIK